MNTKINKIKTALSIVLVFLGMMGFGQTNPESTLYPKTIQTWMYPELTNGYALTTINQKSEFADGRVIDALKPQYLILNSNGGLDVQMQTSTLPHAYSQTNVQHIINNNNPSISGSFNSYVTISSNQESAAFQALLNSSTLQDNFVNFVENFLNNSSNNYPLITTFTGVELDLENPTNHWNNTNYNNYKLLVNALGTRLHSMSPQRKLIITLPSGLDYSWIKNNVNVDHLCIMLYDNPDNILYQYKLDHGGSLPPVNFDFGGEAPNAWVQQIITEVKDDLMDSPSINDFTQMSSSDKENLNKIIIGMPSYGYHTLKVLDQNTNQYTYSFYPNDSKKLVSTFNGYNTATRDPLSYEMKFYSSSFPENHPVYYQDAIGMSMKVEDIRARGIRNVSVWSLGGNEWFTRFNLHLNNNITNNTIVDNQYKLPTSNSTPTNWSNPTYIYNYDLNNVTTINQYAHVSKDNIGNNEIVLSGYNFGLGINAGISGLELVIIGHSNPLSDQNKSTFSVQLTNGNDYSDIKTFDIHSQHDVIKVLGNSSDKWNIQSWDPTTIDNNLNVIIKLIGGASGDINAVFIKVHNTDCPAISTDYILYSNETWGVGTTTIKNCNVVVNAGKTLTISGTAKFGANCKLIVNNGGRLLVDGGILTNACKTAYWSGIHVCGYGSQFVTSNQGIIELTNNATIENAICGITTHYYEITDNVNGGGIIKANTAYFINNQTAVKMNKYTNISSNGHPFFDLSYFKKCIFITNDNYLKPIQFPFLTFINLNTIKGLDIKACKFLNLSSNIAADYSNAGYGIKGNYIKINIDNYDGGGTEFRNLKYGIYAYSDYQLDGLNVRNAVFNNNHHGLFAKNYNKCWFTSNTFNVPYIIGSASEQTLSYGLYLDHCTGYMLEGNIFDKTLTSNYSYFGLIIHESGAPAALNTVYNNTFKNLTWCGAQIQGNNRGIDKYTGLKVLCNDFSNNAIDLSINPTINGDGISIYQGTNAISNDQIELKKPAGNTFSRLGPTGGYDYTDINSWAASTTYFHHKKFTGNEIWYPYYSQNPDFTSNAYYNVNLAYTDANFPISNRNLACPGKALQTGGDLPYPYEPIQLNSLIQQKSAQLNTSILIHSLWVDGGNTQGLLHDIRISTTWDAFDLYNELLLHSPNLSEEVLIDAIEREDVLTPLMLKLILLANPQATHYERVWNALYNRVNPLPEVWIDEIKQGLTVISPIENMQADISYYANERKTYLDLLKQFYLEDSTEAGLQQYLQLLNNETDFESRYELVFAKIGNQDYEGALISLASIEGMIDADMQPEELDRYANMNTLIPILINVKSGNLIWSDLTEIDKNYLIELSENNRGVPGSLAAALRMQLDTSFVYIEPIYPLIDIPLRMAKSKKQINSIENQPVLKINPNPADEYIEVNYDIKGAINGLNMQITDAMGRKVFEKELIDSKNQQIIVVKDFAKGNYICTIYNNGKPIQNTKFIKK